jgi:hypothetical protein
MGRPDVNHLIFLNLPEKLESGKWFQTSAVYQTQFCYGLAV